MVKFGDVGSENLEFYVGICVNSLHTVGSTQTVHVCFINECVKMQWAIDSTND